MKKEMVNESRIVFPVLILFSVMILTISFVFAAHVITTSTGGTSYSVNEDLGFIYNITVNDTDTTADANITQINITIPNTFSFLADSNGTNAGTHTFTNTSTILSWDNDGLVMNLTWKYFWFNATASTPGSYNLTITTTNATGTETTNISVTINDTTAPVVTLISPAASTSSTTSAYNFTFNVTDDQTILNCSTIFDGSIINTLTSINNSGGTNGMYNSSLAIGTHTWSVNCTDIAGNIGNSSTRTLVINATTTTTSISSGGYPNYNPKEDSLNKGYQKIMYENWRISFKVQNESHTFTVEDVTKTNAKISISSEAQEATFSVGEEKKFELSGDNYYDVLVKLNSINTIWKNKANFTIQTIHEEIASQQGKQESKAKEEVTQVSPEVKVREEKVDLTWLWVLIAVIIILILSGFGYKKLSRQIQ